MPEIEESRLLDLEAAMGRVPLLEAALSLQPAYTAHPEQGCLNGCMRGSGDARGPVLTEGHALLCSGKGSCTERLGIWLRAVPEAYALLPSVVQHGSVPSDPGTKHTKQPDAPAPFRLEVRDLVDSRRGYQHHDDGTPILSDNRRGVLGLLHGWATVVREERNQPARCTCGHMALGHREPKKPALPWCSARACTCMAYRAIAPTVSAEVALLVSNLPWIVEQDLFAKDFYDEIRILNRTLTDTIGDYRAKPVGKCAVLTERPGVPLPVLCGGALVMDREGHGVHCLTCGAKHRASDELRELGLIVGQLWDNGNDQQEAS